MTSTDRRAVWERVPGLHEISNGKNKVYRNMVRLSDLAGLVRNLSASM